MKTILVDAVESFIIPDGGGWKIFAEMQALLDSFPNNKIILTGATRAEGFAKYGLDKVPYEVFTLEHNPEKTDPAYFKTMLEHYGLASGDAVYFEHNPEAVKSAGSVGIASYYYDEKKADLAALKEFLATHLN